MGEPTAAENPLLQQTGLPRFDLIKDEHVEPGMRALLGEATARFDALERTARPEWSLLEELERIGERVGYGWNIVGHLLGVRNTAALRAAHEAVQPEIVAFNIRVSQSEPVYKALCELRDGPAWSHFDAAQRRIVEQSIKEAELSGIALEGEARARFNQIQTELAELSTRFGNNVLDSTKAFELVLTDPAEVDGLPERARRLYAQSARTAGHEGATAESGP
ncbi:MAG TPA: M3 family peptidase, partial [Limnochordia bacterium]|nr:M3 family peptidase [Limnochordia bacterium]